MNFEQVPTLETAPSINPAYRAAAERFLADQSIPQPIFEDILNQIEVAEYMESGPEIRYDKYKKSFFLGDKAVTAGALLSSRHLGYTFSLPESLDNSLEGRRLRSFYRQKRVEDTIFDQINKVLALALAENTQSKDMLKAEAYRKIAERSGPGKEQNEQLGVIAEKLIYGVAEMIAIDRPDLGITIYPANAYQDVHEKIDFIIETSQKRRGAKVDTVDLDHKHIGIQFTINTSKEFHKKDQIAKAKARGIDVDDIVYVALDSTLLRKALYEWEKVGKPVEGPWAYLSTDTKKKAIEALFHEVLTPEQEVSLLKYI